MNKLWHENSTNEKEDTRKCAYKLASAGNNLISEFTADRHQLERTSFLTKKFTLHISVCYQVIEHVLLEQEFIFYSIYFQDQIVVPD
jgi:hypothetical protein